MNLMTIDKYMLLQELYKLLSLIDIENIEARDHLNKLINLINNIPLNTVKSNYPRIGVSRQ